MADPQHFEGNNFTTVDGSEIRLTTQHVGNPVNHEIFTISTGDRRISEPSTVCLNDPSNNTGAPIGMDLTPPNGSICPWSPSSCSDMPVCSPQIPGISYDYVPMNSVCP